MGSHSRRALLNSLDSLFASTPAIAWTALANCPDEVLRWLVIVLNDVVNHQRGVR